MPKFRVFSSETIYYVGIVEADNKEEAGTKIGTGEVLPGEITDAEDFKIYSIELVSETEPEELEEELDTLPKYYALFMNGDAENEITFHFTRKKAEEHLLKRASEDNINADTYFELEKIMEEMLVSGDQTARIEIGTFENWSQEIPDAIS